MKRMVVINQSYEEYEARDGIKKGKNYRSLGILVCLGSLYLLYIAQYLLFSLVLIVGILLIVVGDSLIKKHKKKLKKALVKKVEIQNKK